MEIIVNHSSDILLCGSPHKLNPLYFNICSPCEELSIQESPEKHEIIKKESMYTYPLYMKRCHSRIVRSSSWSF